MLLVVYILLIYEGIYCFKIKIFSVYYINIEQLVVDGINLYHDHSGNSYLYVDDFV